MSAIRVGFPVTEEIVKKLKSLGITTVVDFIRKDVEELAQLSGIAYKDLLALRRIFLAQYSAFPTNGVDVYNSEVTSTSILSTGCNNVDRLLDGGLYTSEVTEVAGEIAAGKTQIMRDMFSLSYTQYHPSFAVYNCYQIRSTYSRIRKLRAGVAYPSGAAELISGFYWVHFCMSCTVSVAAEYKQNVVYVDTCGTFCAERLMEIVEAKYGLQDVEKFLSCVNVIHSFDIFSLLSELEDIKSKIAKKNDSFYGNLRLVVIDNVPSVIYPVLGGQQMDGHGLMVQLGQKLKHLAVDYQLTILIANNIVINNGEKTASLGKTWSHVPHTRVMITHDADLPKSARRAIVMKSSRMAINSQVLFSLGTKGIEDPG